MPISQQENEPIYALKNLTAEDIEQIEVPIDTLTDQDDIALCLAGLKSIRLKSKEERGIDDNYRSYTIWLKDREKIELKFDYEFVVIDDNTYSYDDSNNPTTTGTVTLTSQGNTYYAYTSGICGLDYAGTLWDGAAFEPWAMDFKYDAEILRAIPYADDYLFDCVWNYDSEMRKIPLYTVYAEKGNRLSKNADKLEIPKQPGIYYVEISMSWGADYRYDSFECFFKIIRD